jgi:hypothetical protein
VIRILVSHAGFACDARKRALLPPDVQGEFVLQDLEHNAAETLADFEDWRVVYRGALRPFTGELGRWSVADFSAWTGPGLFRVVVPGTEARSIVFPVHDGVLAPLPRMFLDFLHANRCGPFENAWRGPCHLDDGVLSETGEQVDVVGGWHDAGDARKWSPHTLNPILGLVDIFERLGWASGSQWGEQPWPDDLHAEVAWAAAFGVKMQDPASGMFWEDVGGGGSARVPAEQWWYENHAGCGGDNSDNRFTDNVRGSGDERRVRQQYNAVAQYTLVSVLARAARLLAPTDAELAGRCLSAAERGFACARARGNDVFHGWTSVRAWRVLASLELEQVESVDSREAETALESLFELFDQGLAWFFMDNDRRQPYRAIPHAAQPLLALIAFAERRPGHPLAERCRAGLDRCFSEYVTPLCEKSAFRIMPYGVFREPATRDRYRTFRDGLTFRFFMPVNAEPPVNHGLAGHWTSWAHALAAGGVLLGRKDWTSLALDQLHWLLGFNPDHASFVSGFGHGQPLPYSRLYGAIVGGFMNGPRATSEDTPFVDLEWRIDWGSAEYWNLPLANALLALSHLLPIRTAPGRRLGRS